MESNVLLIIHNVGAIISGTVAVVVAIFILVNNRKAKVNITIALINIAVAVFCFSHLIGTNIVDPHLSRTVLMFNMSVIFIVVFNVHAVLIVLKKDIERRYVIYTIYALGIGFVIFFSLFPDTFLLDSVPKMYFPNYYVPGSLHWLMRLIFDVLIPIYMAVELFWGAVKNPNAIERNRAKFFGATIVIGYLLGLFPLFLIFNIPIDPLWGMLFVPVYCIPLVYGIITYDLTDVRIIARKASLYGVAIATICSFLLLFNYSDRLVRQVYSNFPIWIIPFLSATIAVGIGVFVWKKLREDELLKYEFITVVTHKFRTPLTHIKWAAENLSKSNLNEEDKNQISFIETANTKLVELTSLLMNVSEAENKGYGYDLKKNNMTECVDELIFALTSVADSRKVKIVKEYSGTAYALFDIGRLKFVIQTFIENAIHYTPINSIVTVSITQNQKEVIFSVKDQGLGITKEELSLLFSKFYRGKQARLADTEGMGIGLFISKQVIARHNGRTWADSAGAGKGSTFSFALPIIKQKTEPTIMQIPLE